MERETECAAIEAHLDDALDGLGSLLVIEGSAGSGKSRLVNLAGDMARQRDVRVLEACGTELERHYPFGIAIRLFEPWWFGTNEGRRTGSLDDTPSPVTQLLTNGPGSAESDDGFATIHGLFRAVSRLATAGPEGDGGARGAPLLMLIDDAQWADGPSLRFLAYVAARVSDLPIAMVVAMRLGEPGADTQTLVALRSSAGSGRLRLKSLSPEAVDAIVRAEFPQADETFSAACSHVTNGNPLLLLELLRQVRADDRQPNGDTASQLEGLAPESILDAVMARLGAMPPAVTAVARAVAVLGDGAALRRTARLAGLDTGEAARASDALAEAHLFGPGEPVSFLHPLLRDAVERSIAPLDRMHAHHRAALILDEEGEEEEVIAPHLLAAPSQADPRTVMILRAAARKAMASGAWSSAVRILRRALGEGSQEGLSDLLGELAEAEAAADLPEAAQRFGKALDLADGPHHRAALGLAQATFLYRRGEYRGAANVLVETREAVGNDNSPVAGDLAALYVATISLLPERVEETRLQGDRLLTEIVDPPGPHQRVALAHLAWHQALCGERREPVRSLADRAWSDGDLLDGDIFPDSSWPLISAALLAVDELERDLEVCDVALAHAVTRESMTGRAIANVGRAWALYERGEITAAEACASSAFDSLPTSGPGQFHTACSALACCRIQKGQLDEAESALTVIQCSELCPGDQLPALLGARALLRLAQRRPQDALDDAERAGARWETTIGPHCPGALGWRSLAALAHLALGQRSQARDLACEELALARQADVPRLIMRNLRVLGLVEGGRRGLELLTDAVDLGREHPDRLEHVSTLVALGGALRRSNQRSAAREPLQEALARAQQGGATSLALHAQTELTATGARPRTASRWGPESLTPSERRVAGLAVDRLTTREIAETLFVTPKTVEFHLRHIYQKLGVNSRDKLGEALSDQS